MMKRRSIDGPAPSTATAHVSSRPSSSSIPFPRSHVRRTPSEIHLAEEILRTKHDDVRTYARIVAGLQGQNFKNQGIVHPLSQRSLQGIVKTKQASHEELEQRDGGHTDDWEVSLVECRDDGDASLRWSTQTPPPLSKTISDISMSSHGSIKNQDEDDDGCVFVLEL